MCILLPKMECCIHTIASFNNCDGGLRLLGTRNTIENGTQVIEIMWFGSDKQSTATPQEVADYENIVKNYYTEGTVHK
jgi:hypothetical protein